MAAAGWGAARSTGTVIHEHGRRFHLALDLQPAPRRDGSKLLLLTGGSSLNPDPYSHGRRTVCKPKLPGRFCSTAFPVAAGGVRLAGVHAASPPMFFFRVISGGFLRPEKNLKARTE